MVQDMEYGGLQLTSRAWAVFKGEEQVYGRLPEKTPEKPAVGKNRPAVVAYDRDLFELLREKRLAIARELDVPPFVIFADRTLAEMASAYPRTPESLLGIHGVGRAKCEKYGALFTDIIMEYCMLNDIDEPRPAETPSAPNDNTPAAPRRYQEVGALYSDGKSIAELMRQYRVKLGTILGHLVRYHAEGNALRPDGLREACSLSGEQVDAVIKAFDTLGTDFLKPVFEALDGTVGYEELRLLRLYYLNSQT